MATAAETIAQWSTTIAPGDIPDDVKEHAKLHVLDVLGCGLAAHAIGLATEGRATMRELGGEPQATVIGWDGRLPAANAAFANAMVCHGLDFDDTHSDSGSHVSVVVTPAALAAAELYGSSGADALAAIVAGNEIDTRIGMAAPGVMHGKGFHPTAICGVFAGTAAIARLAGMTAEPTTRAIGIAGSMASGIFAYLADGTQTKPIHPAWAAHGAHVATRLAHHGGEGPRSVFDAKFGLYHTFLGIEPGSGDLEKQVADLGSRWETPRIAYKPYPICHFTHGAVGSAVDAVAGRLFAPDEIAEVVVSVPDNWIPIVLEPADEKKVPRTEYEGKFSLQYAIASMLVRGHVGVMDFTEEAITDAAVLAVAAKVSHEPRTFSTYPEAFPGSARIRLASGDVLEKELPYQKGGPENPISADEVRAKFRGNAALALPEDAVAALEEAILTLDEQPDVTTALRPLTATKLVAA
ncbi:MAG: MmgE/PrpD family protein [Actinobacteria bacterium]|nr:MmgE/PrpD family protein [Actinomycetota bacterium]